MSRKDDLIGFSHLLKTRKQSNKQSVSTQISPKAQSLDTNEIPVRIFAWGFSANRVVLISHDYQFLHCTNVVIKFFSPD